MTNTELLEMIEKSMDAKAICEKMSITMGTLRRRHHVLMMNARKFIEVPGLFESDNEVELKKGGITISAKKLDSLKCPWPQGTKLEISIDSRQKGKLTLKPVV